MKKNYLLDTNVLLHDPNCLLSFQDNNVLIPIEVIEEIDRFKRESTELGRNARTVSRMLDGWRARGPLSEGVQLPGGGLFRIVFERRTPPATPGGPQGASRSVDNLILTRALGVRDAEPTLPLVVVTKDINLRLKADTLGLVAEDYETDRVQLSELYSGIIEKPATAEMLAKLLQPFEQCPRVL